MSTFNAGAIEARLTLDRTSWGTDLKRVQQEIRDLENTHIDIMIDVDKTNADIQLDNLENDLLLLENDPPNINIDVDATHANLVLDLLEGRLDALDIRRVVVQVDADVDNALIQLGLVENDMDVLENDPVNINVDVDSAAAHAKLVELQAMVGVLDGRDIDIGVDIDRSFLSLVQGGGGGGGHLGLLRILIYSILALLPVLSVAMTSLVGAIGAMAAAMAAAGGALLVFGGGIALLIQRFKDAKEAGTMTAEMKLLDKALDALNESLDKFTDLISEKGFEVMAQGVQLLADVLPAFAPVFNAAADAVSNLLDGIEEFTQSQDFKDMINFFSGFGADMIESFGTVIGQLIVFFGLLFEAFEPLAREMMAGLEDLTAGWVEWARGLEDNEAFQDFLDDVRKFGPMVLDFLGSMVLAFINLGEALEPFAGPMLTGLTAFFDFIAEADPQALSIGIAAIAAAFIGWKVIPPLIGGLSALAGVLASITLPMILIAGAIAIVALAFYDLWKNNEEFRQGFIDTWNELVENVKPIIEDFTEFFKEHWDEIKAWFIETFEIIKEVVVNFFDLLNGIIQLGLEIIGYIWEHWGDEIINIITAVFTFIGNFIQNALKLVSSIFKLFADIIHGRWGKVWQDVKDIWNNFWTFIGNAFRDLWNLAGRIFGLIGAVIKEGWNIIWPWLKDKFSDFVGWIKDRWNDLIGWFKGIPGRVGNALSGVWDGLVDSFKDAINAIIGFWNNLNLVIDIPDKIPGLPDSWTINTPDFPKMADGGILTRSTIVEAGEEGPEAIMPLSRLQEFVDNSRTELDYGRLGGAVAAALASVLARMEGLGMRREDIELLASMLGVNIQIDARDEDSGEGLARNVGYQLRLLGLGGKDA